MFITIVIRSEYSPYSYRANFYQQCLNACLDNKWILITNEYMKYHHQEMQDGIVDRFIREFNIRKISSEEFNTIEQYYIPDKLFEDKESSFGSRTEMLSYLASEEFPELEICFSDILQKIRIKHPSEKIDGVLHCAETCQAFRNVCKKENLTLIPYLFSAIKIPHGYRQTMYYTALEGQLFNSNECERRYKKFLEEDSNIPVLSHREILAIIGKERTMPLLQLIDHKPKYEMGICCECRDVIPQFYNFNIYTDDDTFLECEELFKPEEIKVRSHAMQLDHIQMDRSDVRNDAAPFILSCKRLTSVRSQITLKNLLWKRTAVMKKPTLDFSFMCETDYKSEKLADIKAINFYVFANLIPANLMFSRDYWKWRMTRPSETEIYHRHLQFIMNELEIDSTILEEKDENKRFEKLLRARYCDEELIPILIENDQNFEVDYEAISSKFVIEGKNHWRINKVIEDSLVCKIEEKVNALDSFDFYPIDDCAGFAKLISVYVNGKPVEVLEAEFKYMKKVTGHYTIILPEIVSGRIVIECKWQHQTTKDYLAKH